MASDASLMEPTVGGNGSTLALSKTESALAMGGFNTLMDRLTKESSSEACNMEEANLTPKTS